jgi:hypothetical protein
MGPDTVMFGYGHQVTLEMTQDKLLGADHITFSGVVLCFFPRVTNWFFFFLHKEQKSNYLSFVPAKFFFKLGIKKNLVRNCKIGLMIFFFQVNTLLLSNLVT